MRETEGAALFVLNHNERSKALTAPAHNLLVGEKRASVLTREPSGIAILEER